MTKTDFNPQHPVEVLKDLGVQMTPAIEAQWRAYVDETVADLERHIIEGECEGTPVGLLPERT
jgi:hypothetical protein